MSSQEQPGSRQERASKRSARQKPCLLDMRTERNARGGCHSNFDDPRSPISSILYAWTNFFSRKKRFLHQKSVAIKPLKKGQVSQIVQTVSA
jgi:hypothetical protein